MEKSFAVAVPSRYASDCIMVRGTSRLPRVGNAWFSEKEGHPLDVLFAALLGLAFLLGLVTLIGHGLWLLFAHLYRAVFSLYELPPPVPERRSCPRCLSPSSGDSEICGVCRWPDPLPKGERRIEVLQALDRQLKLYRCLGIISPETHQKLAATLSVRDIAATREDVPKGRETAPAPAVPVAKTPQPKPPRQAPATVEKPVAPVEAPKLPKPPVKVDDPPKSPAVQPTVTKPAAKPPAEPVASPKPPPRDPLGTIWATFLEEKNIRWGELVGGLLIVCCSTALVISFWAEIAARPLLKFGLFNGVLAGLFGIGFYTSYRWKIQTTSLGILIIAVLLVPLNFLAIAAFTDRAPPTDLLSLGGETLSLGLFSAMTLFAARIIVLAAPAALCIGVMLPSLMQLFVRRFVSEDSSVGVFYCMAAVPMVGYLGVTLQPLHRLAAPSKESAKDLGRLLIAFGISSYAMLVPMALLLYKSGAVATTLQQLSPLVVLSGTPGLAVGLLSLRRFKSHEHVAVQTIAIALGVLGAVVMMAAIPLAWPDPSLLLTTTLVNVVVFALVAWWFVLPEAHLPAGLCAIASWLIGFHLLWGNIAWDSLSGETLIRVVVSGSSGNALTPLVVVYALIAVAWRRVARPVDSFWWLVAASVTAAISLTLVTVFGFGLVGDPIGVTWTYAFYTVVALVAAAKTDRISLSWIASGFLLMTLGQGIVYRLAPEVGLAWPWIVVFLLHSSLCLLGERAVDRWSKESIVDLPAVLLQSGVVTSVAAATITLMGSAFLPWITLAGYWLWVSILWMVISFVTRRGDLFLGFQLSLSGSLLCGVTSLLAWRSWYLDAPVPWLDAWFLQSQGIAFAIYCLLWQALRVINVRWKRTMRERQIDPSSWRSQLQCFLDEPAVSLDRVYRAAILLLLIVLTTYAVMPGIAQELATRDQPGMALRHVTPLSHFEIEGIFSQRAAGIGSWILLIAVGILMSTSLFGPWSALASLGLLVTASMMCPLFATAWTDQVSVASALRWLLVGFAFAASIPIWWRHRLRPHLAKHGIKLDCSQIGWPLSTSALARGFLMVLVVVPHLAMVIIIGSSVFERVGYPLFAIPLLKGVASAFAVTSTAALLIWLFASSWETDDGPFGGRYGMGWKRPIQLVLLFLGTGPLVVTLMAVVVWALQFHPIVGPNPGTLFHGMGWIASYGVPVVVFATMLMGYTVRERRSWYANGAALLLHLVATLAVLIEFVHPGMWFDGVTWITIAQVNAIVSAVVALLWLASILWLRSWMLPKETERVGPHTWPTPLVTHTLLAVALCWLTLGPAVVGLIVKPVPSLWVVAAGSSGGWTALMLTLATLTVFFRHHAKQFTVHHLGCLLVTLAVMLSMTAAQADQGDWFAYHTLLFTLGATAFLLSLARYGAWESEEKPQRTTRIVVWSSSLGSLTVVLGLRALDGDPEAPWWTLYSLVAMSALATWLAWSTANRGFLWVTGFLANGATTIWWITLGHRLTNVLGVAGFVHELLLVNIVVATLVCLISIVFEWVRFVPMTSRDSEGQTIGFHHLGVPACLVTLLLTTSGVLVDSFHGTPSDVNWGLHVTALIGTSIAVASSLLLPVTRLTVPSFYSLGLIAIGVLLSGLRLEGERLFWTGTLTLAGFAMLTSLLWRVRKPLENVLVRASARFMKSTTSTFVRADEHHAWLVFANVLLAMVVTAMTFRIELTSDLFVERMSAACSLLAITASLAFLASGAFRDFLQTSTLACGVFFAVAFGWSWMPPTMEGPILHRAIVAAVAMVVMAPCYGFGIAKWWRGDDGWAWAAQRLNPVLAGLAALLLVVILGIEVGHFAVEGTVPIRWPGLLAVAAALSGLIIAALAAALLPGRDPLGMSERGRTAYVYAAEMLLGLLFLHFRLSMPWLFQGWFLQFWPLVVMGVAFVGVGVAEGFRRLHLRVLYEPLENTGALLPLLPVLGFWLLSSAIDYPLVLLLVGALYTVLSSLRRSLFFGIVAVVAFNGGLWNFLHEMEGLGFLQHPQLWLVPPALCALVAAYLNRSRLTNEQMSVIRYAAAIVIYSSSTADIFLNGVGEEPWLPLVLGGLSLLGIFAGILLQVRALLYLGLCFLVVTLLTVIWHAAVELEMTWIWWVSGVVTGALIIALFGVFEKKRDELLRLVDQVKQWEA